MEKIYLPKSCKKILRKIQNNEYDRIPVQDTADLLFLENNGLVRVVWCEFGYAVIANLTEKGIIYLHINPKLKNPSIFEDKKFWINTAISVAALVVAIIALFNN